MTVSDSLDCLPAPSKSPPVSRTRTLRLTISAPLRMLLVTEALKQLAADEGIEIDPAAVDLIQSLSVRDLQAAVESEQTLTVELNVRKLISMLQQRLDPDRLTSDQCLDYFLQNGASAPLIQRLFKRPRREIQRMFDEVGLDQEKRKAIGYRLPGPRERDAIHRAWNALPEQGMRGYVELHRQFPHWPLTALDRVLNEFKE